MFDEDDDKPEANDEVTDANEAQEEGQATARAFSPAAKPAAATLVFDFPDALRQVMQGHKITKLEWNNMDYYLAIVDNKLCIHKPEADAGGLYFYPLTVTDGDLRGTDYIIVSPGSVS